MTALVDDGWFTAWWPGGAEDEITVTLTLADGERSTRTIQTGDR